MSYAPMPSDPGPYGVPSAAPVGEPPPAVRNAVRLMFASATVGLVNVVLVLLLKSELRTAIQKADPGYDSAKLDSAVNAGIAVAIVIGVVFVVLYVLLALQVRKGRNWARIVTWVIAGLGVLSFLSSFAQPTFGLSRVFSTLAGLIDIGIVVLLALRESNEYFRALR